jgi:hypothetical protein
MPHCGVKSPGSDFVGMASHPGMLRMSAILFRRSSSQVVENLELQEHEGLDVFR